VTPDTPDVVRTAEFIVWQFEQDIADKIDRVEKLLAARAAYDPPESFLSAANGPRGRELRPSVTRTLRGSGLA
jgi:hypothetical protein